MARYEFKLPDIGEGVTEGEIVSWHVEAGDVVKEDQPMVEVMTDKATVTITSPRAGEDRRDARRRSARSVPVHSVLVVFELDGARRDADGAPAATAPSVERRKRRRANAKGEPSPPRSATSRRPPGMSLGSRASRAKRARSARGADERAGPTGTNAQATTSTKALWRRRRRASSRATSGSISAPCRRPGRRAA